MRRLSLLSLSAVLILPLASLAAQESDEEWLLQCRESHWGDWSSRVHHCEIRETGLKPSGKPLVVDPSVNGGAEIESWDTDSIAVTARIQVNAATSDEANRLAQDIRIEASGATVRASGPEPTGRHQNWSVSFVVLVPRRTDLSISTENGPVSVKNVNGHMELSTVNGPLYLSGVGGDVHARAENGPLGVRLAGTRWDGTGLDAETMNGPADLRIPTDYNAKIEFGTVNGPMDVGFPLTVTLSGRVRDRISTTLGSGGPSVRVVTTNGPMTVRRSAPSP
jgi:DUF4097 and DUF4098 domain-containing protein YvlB